MGQIARLIWCMYTNTVMLCTNVAARKRDEMLEPYEWKHSRTVLRRESGSNPAYLVDIISGTVPLKLFFGR